jgi:superfamily II DNA or RNA helicase
MAFIDKEIKEKLIATPKSDGYSMTRSFSLYTNHQGDLIIPRYFGIKKIGKPDEEQFELNPECHYKFTGKLRKNQIDPAKAVLKAFNEKGGGILSLMTGGGKTLLSLYFIYKLKTKTIVIVNRVELINQWTDEIRKNLPDARIGKIQGEVIDVVDKDIVLAMINTVSMKKFPLNTFNSFDLLIVDECHTIGSEVFSQCLPRIRTPYTLGLSATPSRRDNLMYVVEYYLGPICYVSENKINSEKTVIVDIIKYDCPISSKYNKELVIEWNGRANISAMINNMVADEERTIVIVNYLKSINKKNIVCSPDKKRKLLLLSDRKNLLKKIKEHLDKEKISSELYTGNISPNELQKAKQADFILATYSIASTGFNLPDLNTLFMATPRKNVEQSIGRILRKEHNISPAVIDLLDTFSIFKYMGIARENFYRKNNFDIRYT